MSVPDVPTFTSQPLVTSSTSVTVEFSLGSNGGSALEAIEYARGPDYATWASLPGLITPLENNTTATITGLLVTPYGSYKIRSVNAIGNSESTAAIAYTLNNGEYYPKVVFSSDNQYAIARKFNDGGVNQAAVSTDGGITWTAITPPNSEACTDVAMSLDGGYMYYTSSGGVYISINYGLAFLPLNNAPASVFKIVCDSTGEKVYCSSANGYIYRSINSGTSFTPSLANFPLLQASDAMACSASGQYLYVSVGTDLYRSINSGDVISISTQFPNIIKSIACDQTGERVYLACENVSVLCSLDYGVSFFQTSLTNNTSITVACDSLGNRIISEQTIGSTFVSYDAGTSWKLLRSIGPVDYQIVLSGSSISPDGTRYVSCLGAPGTYIDVEGTPDVAPVWTVINNTAYMQGSISVDNQRIVAVQTNTGGNNIVVYSSNGGDTWSSVTDFGNVYQVKANLSGEIVLATLLDPQVPSLSTTYGDNFSPINITPVGSFYFTHCMVNFTGTSMMVLSDDSYVYVSTDSGVTWNSTGYQFEGGYIFSLCGSASMDRIYCGLFSSNDSLPRIYVSTNMGTSWTLQANPASDIDSIACDWSGQNVVFAAYGEGVYRSINGGLSWTQTTAPTSGNMSRIVSNSTGNRIVVASTPTSNGDYVAYVSIDAGVTWTTLPTPDTYSTSDVLGFIVRPDGSLTMAASNQTTYFQPLGTADLPLLPGAPFFTSAIIVDSSTITIEFAVGYPGVTALTAIEYARDTDNYATWTTITGLTTPLEDATSATITGLTPPSTGSYKIRSVNSAGPSAASAAAVAYQVINGEYYTKVIFSSDNQYAIARKFNDGGVDQAAVSSDGGATWTAITPPTGSCNDVAMSLDGTVMYYTSHSDGLYKSTGHSTTFTPVSAAPLLPNSIVCNSTGQRVFVHSDNDYYMYVSDNAGTSFIQGANTLNFRVLSIVCNESGDHIYVVNGSNVYLSTNYFATFNVTSTLDDILTSVTCDQTGKLVFVSAMGGYGVYVSVNYGVSFVQTSYNSDNSDDVSIVVCDSLGNRLTSLTPAGIIRVSYDAGTTWSTLPPIPGQSLTFTSGGVAISPDGTRYVSTLGTPGTYINVEGTPDVAPIWTVLNNVSYYGGSISTDNQRIVAEYYNPIDDTNVVAYSSNAGANWNEAIPFGSVEQLVASASGEIVLACMNDDQVPFRSINYGQTFTSTSLILVGTVYPTRAVMDSTGTSMMAVASDGYVYKSINSGDEWTNPYQFTDGYAFLQCSSTSMDRIYVTVYPTAGGSDITYFSTDVGSSWTSLGASPSISATNNIACDWSGMNLVLCTSTDGVYRSTNGGVSWTHIPFPSGSYMENITSNSTGNRIVVLDSNNYIFYVSLDAGTTWSTLSTPDTYWNGTNTPMISPDGSYVITTSGTNTYVQTLGAADLPPGSATVPDAPSFTSSPTIISNTSISIDFTLGADGGSTITGIEYARAPSYDTWVPISGLTSPVTITVDSPSTGGYKIRSVNAIGNSDPSAEGFVLAIAPAAPSFTSTPTAVNTTSINIAFSLGFNGGLDLMDLEYARDTDSYATWFSVGLSLPLEGQTTATITGLTPPVTGNYKIRAANDVGPSAASAAGLVSGTIPCFLEGSKILCQVDGVEKYVAVETIRPGTLVKTSRDGFQPVKLIGSRPVVNVGGDNRDKNSLYLCTKANYPELTEDLVITGCHAILVDHITDAHRQGIINTLERVFVTDKKYRLPACVDERATVHQATGDFTVWHFALEHTDIKMNYGVYAHGLLVESSPIWHMNTKNYTLVQ